MKQASYCSCKGFWAILLWFMASASSALASSDDPSVIPSKMHFKRLLTGSVVGEPSIGIVRAIIQDSTGFIWIGGVNGLVRFDSHSYKFYQPELDNPRTLPDNYVIDMVIDDEDRLWIATVGGLVRYEPHSDDFELIPSLSLGDKEGVCDHAISAIAVDHLNQIIVAANDCLTVIDASRTKFKHIFDGDNRLPDNTTILSIEDIFVDKNNKIWIVSREHGLMSFRPDFSDFQTWRYNQAQEGGIHSDFLTSVWIDQKERLWLGSLDAGVARQDVRGGPFKRLKLKPPINSNFVVRELYEDHEGVLWVATDHAGIARYDESRDDFTYFFHDPYNLNSLSSNNVHTIAQDRKGDLWFGNFPTGVNYFDRSKSKYKTWTHSTSDETSISHNGILSIFRDSQGVMWVGTENGLNRYDKTSGEFTRFYANPSDPHALRSDVILCINEDENGLLWIGTWSGGLHTYDRSTNKFKNYYPGEEGAENLAGRNVWDIVFIDNEVWIGTGEGRGLSVLDRSSGEFTTFSYDSRDPNSLPNHFVWDLAKDRYGNLWIATLHGLTLKPYGASKFRIFQSLPGNKNTISDNNVRYVFEDSRGLIWVGTDSGIDIVDPKTLDIRRLKNEIDVPVSTVATIEEDLEGNIWIGRHDGLLRIDYPSLDVRIFTKEDGLAGHNINRKSSWVDDNGVLFIGSTDGITYFHPNDIRVENIPPKVVLTDFKIFNKSVSVYDNNKILDRHITFAKHIELTENDNMFSIDFTALNFRSSSKNQYAYRLEGFDDEWRYVKSRRTAVYTNLSPGDYKFKVRASDNYGNWNMQGASLDLNIKPLIWKTWQAYTIYTFIFFGVILFIFHIKRMQYEKEKALEQLKNAFLENTSHELKTPLNGMLGATEVAAENLLKGDVIKAKDLLDVAKMNGRRLVSLLDDIFDFSKLADNSLKLNFAPVSVERLLQLSISSIEQDALQRGIGIARHIQPHYVLGDEKRLTKVLTCLLKNALKYTEVGTITVSATVEDAHIVISVTDTGIGISPENLTAIFSAFRQLDFSESRSYEGVGLGLAISQRLLMLHGAKLLVESKVGQGSTFSFSLPIVDAPKVITSKPATSVSPAQTETEALAPTCSVLVVDDEAVNRLIISSFLKLENYTPVLASGGQEALDAMKEHPEIRLVLLDVMMPNMSGYEVCEELRRHYDKDTLPVIFVTAKTLDDALYPAKAAGGNEVLTKPLDKVAFNETLKRYLS